MTHPSTIAAPDAPASQYYAVFLESRQLGYEIAPGTWGSALLPHQWVQLDAYLAEFSVRSVALYSWPWFDGVDLAPASSPSTFATVDEVFAENDGAYLSHANGGGPINTIHSWVTPADCSNSVTVEEVARFHSGDPDDADGQGGSAMAVQTLATGAERLHYFFIPTVFHPSQIAALNLGIQWAVKGLFLGERRLNLAMQIDDLFLATPEWSLENPIDDDDIDGGTRITAADMAKLKAYQEAASAQLPEGSDIKYEWALNGAGVEDAGGIDADALAQQSRVNREDFWYVSHTYSHPNLDEMSKQACKDEITDNAQFVEALWGPSLPSTWSASDLVPPSISGLFNGECLEGLQEAGIYTEVGDNSRSELIPTTSLYHGIWTSEEVHGQSGTFIIPRFATNIFYNNAIPQNNLDHFNTITSLGWTWEELMEYEGDTVTRWLLQWRHDPYMFHQSNIAFASYPDWPYNDGEASLMSLWTQTVVDHLKPYTALPVVSWRQSEMRSRLIKRMGRDACNIDARLVVTDGVAVQVVAESAGNCEMAVSGVAQTSGSSFASESYGPEFTVYAELRAGNAPVTIPTGLSAPPPSCNPRCDADHGVCNTDADPPACECDIGWGGADCSSPSTYWGGNAVSDTGFEVLNQDGSFTYWYDYGLGGVTVGDHDTWTGNNGAEFTADTEDEAHGIYQLVWLGQNHVSDIRISGWSEATGVTGIKDGFYAVYADLAHTDGTWTYGVTAAFDTGTHGWQYAEKVVTPEKPVESIWLYVMFSYHAGTANFDDIAVEMAVPPDGGPVSTDGRCGFNSPHNAVCREGSCCSDAGWCQTSCESEEPREYAECQVCWGTTSGPCKTADGVCWPLVSEGPFIGTCPAGSVPCDDVGALNDPDATVVEAQMTLTGISEDGFSDELQLVFADTVADEAGATGEDDGASIASVTPSDPATGASRRRRMQESGGRRLATEGLSATQCRVMALGSDTVRVRLVLAVGADGPAGEELVANLKHSLDSGSLATALEANGLGVTPQIVGEPQVVPAGGCAAGLDIGTFIGAVVAALIVGVCAGGAFMAVRNARAEHNRSVVKSVDRSKVGKSDSTKKLELPRVGSGSRMPARRTSQEDRQLLSVGVDSPIGAVDGELPADGKSDTEAKDS